MHRIDYIEIRSGDDRKRIEFLQGDLTAIPPEHAVDVLVVSAFPDDYLPTRRSVVGALHRKGISLAGLALAKEADLREAFSCWLSKEILGRSPGLEFKRILCFEPANRGRPPELVGDIFRALAPFVYGSPSISTVAMPILAAGDQGYPLATMLRPLVQAAYQWLSIGFPLKVLKIVSRDAGGAHIFKELKANFPVIEPDEKAAFDVFVSYSRKDDAAGSQVANALRNKFRVFFDLQCIDTGVAWQQRIFEALESCRQVIAIYSPDYVTSKVCQEEFNIAWARARKLAKKLIFPIYWRSANLPIYMEILNYVDCREAQSCKLEQACEQLVTKLW